MKEDTMKNGQLKQVYNFSNITENQFITNIDFFSNHNDTLTLTPFLHQHENRYGQMPDKTIADAGYGSEENYAFMESNKI